LPPTPKPQIPNPQSPIPIFFKKQIFLLILTKIQEI
jgi:hypothetical protein